MVLMGKESATRPVAELPTERAKAVDKINTDRHSNHATDAAAAGAASRSTSMM